jgi:hypothetical protein
MLLLQTQDDAPTEEIQTINEELRVLLNKEELWWSQRAKEEWLKHGDRNTKYYHACANSKRRKNFIGAIVDESGQKWENQMGVEQAFVGYLANLFTMG